MEERRRKAGNAGFTLIELMIVIAILAILAAVAIPQYNAYKRRAKAKDLVDFAQKCAQQYVAECMVGTPTVTELEACQAPGDTTYISGISIDASGLSCTDGSASGSVTASGTVEGQGYEATCTVTSNDISCEMAKES